MWNRAFAKFVLELDFQHFKVLETIRLSDDHFRFVVFDLDCAQ